MVEATEGLDLALKVKEVSVIPNPRRRTLPISKMSVGEALEKFACRIGNSPRIVFVRPFVAFSARAYSTAATLPIGIAYLHSILSEAGYNAEIIDGLGEAIDQIRTSSCGEYIYQGLSVNDIIRRIPADAEIICISMMFSQNWPQNRDLIKDIKKARPNAIVVVGGEHASALPELTLSECREIDFLVKGEGEFVLLELVHRVATGLPTNKVAGVCYIDQSGEFVETGLAPRIADFQNLPWPSWKSIPVENYFTGAFSMGIGHGRNMIILATRGCPYQCTFCSNVYMWTTRYLIRDPKDVVDEIEWLVDEFGCNSVDFADLTAIVKQNWIIEFCDELERRKIKIKWQLPSGTRSEALDEETIKRLYKANCRLLVFAPESGSRRTLEEIKKKLDPERIIESMRNAAKVGHTTKACTIVGFPNETRLDVYKTLILVGRLAIHGVNDCNISPFSPYPGSELFFNLQKSGVIAELDDGYFKSLLGQFDFTATKAYCANIPGWELAIYRFLGMVMFYSLSYLFFPRRIWRVLKSIFGSKFQPGSLAEQRIYDYVVRNRMMN